MEIQTTIKILCNSCELEFSKEFDGTLPECPECKSKLISIIGYMEKNVEKKETEFVQVKKEVINPDEIVQTKVKTGTRRIDVLMGKFKRGKEKVLKFK